MLVKEGVPAWLINELESAYILDGIREEDFPDWLKEVRRS